jgi:putative ABC transport system permease protein
MPWQVADRPLENKANRQGGFFKIVSASYFSTFRLQLLNGRGLSDRDVKSSPRVLVINERLAKRDFKDANPVGRRLLIEEIIPGKTELGPDIAWEIVGVIRDEKVNGMDDDRSAGVYVSNEQSPAYGGTLSVRATTNPATLLKSITAAIRSVDKDQAITDIRTVDEIKELSVAPNRMQSTLLGIFGTVALLLAAIGIYGVISYSVAQRTHEIGIRAALGATNAALMRLILVRGLVLTAAGLVIGLAGALGLTRLMTIILYKVGARDPGTMIAVAVVLAAVAAAACYVPARRATRVDPLVALRYE